MKKFIHGFLSIALIVGFIPQSISAQEPSEAKYENKVFSIERPSNLSEWYLTPEDESVIIQYVDDSDDDALNTRGGLFIIPTLANNRELALISLYHQMIVGELACHTQEFVTISEYLFEKYSCSSTETSNDKTLRNVTLHFGLIGNYYTIIIEYYGANDMDKAITQEITANINFKLFETDISISEFTSKNTYPQIEFSAFNRNWKTYDMSASLFDEEMLFLFKKANPLHIAAIQYSQHEENSYQQTNKEYLDEKLNSLYFYDDSLKTDILEENTEFKLRPSFHEGIKVITKSYNSTLENPTLKNYMAHYIFRFDFTEDVTITYSLIAQTDSQARESINMFEREILSEFKLNTSEKEISYDDLNIDYYEPSLLWGSSLEGELMSPESSSAVYLVKEDGKRYIFPNEKVYYSWYAGFDNVRQVPNEDLAQYPIGGSLNMRPGTLIKITTVPKVYIVLDDNEIAWIENETAAKRLIGDEWNKKVKDVPDSLFTNYVDIGISIK